VTQSITHGLTGEEVGAIVEKAIRASHEHERPQGEGAEGQIQAVASENEQLRGELASAVRRAADAEARGLPDAGGVIEQLKATGDTAKLMAFLEGHKDLADAFTERAQQERISVRLEIAAVAHLRGEIPRAQQALDEVLAVEPDNLHAINRKGHIYRTLGRLGEAEAAYNRAREIGEAAGNREAEAVACGNLGLIYRTRGQLDKAEEMLRKSLAINEELGRKEGMANQYGNLGLIYRRRGDLAKAEEMHLKSLAIEEQLGRKEGMAADYGNLGLIYMDRGELDKAEEMDLKSLAIEKQLGHKEGMAADYGNLGLIYQTRGDLDKAEEMVRKALTLFEQIGIKHMVAWAQARLEQIAALRRSAGEG
jgi:tetratricopeptide (TPR) repeat protein